MEVGNVAPSRGTRLMTHNLETDIELIKNEKRKSPAIGRIQTYDLLILWRVLYHLNIN